MFRCLLVRHAAAEDRAESGLDTDRALISAGAEMMERVVLGLQHEVVGLERIVASPYLRARQTAEIMADGFGGLPVSEAEVLAAGAMPEEIMQWLATQERVSGIAIVGHEPDMGRFASHALADSRRSFYPMRKAQACLLEFPALPRAGNATLEWALEPEQLAAIGEAAQARRSSGSR